MKKGKRIIISIIIFFIILISFLLLYSINPVIIGNIIKNTKSVEFYFSDSNTGCPLEGYIFVGPEVIGKTEKGHFSLDYYIYEKYISQNPESEISIFGELGECYNESDLLFDRRWEIFEIDENYFHKGLLNFNVNLNPKDPTKRELTGFIQPEKVMNELNKINLNQNTLNDLSNINKYLNQEIVYQEDWSFYKDNYWQTPEETLNLKRGDCEDYSTALLSLFTAYNNTLNCFNIVFTSHVTTFCHVDNYYIYYDQSRTESIEKINNLELDTTVKPKIDRLNRDYFKAYGIEKQRAHYAFNDYELIEFDSEEEYIDWQYSLGNVKKTTLSFSDFDKKIEDINRMNNVTFIGLPSKKPIDYKSEFSSPLILFTLSFVLILLILLLIKVIKK